MVSELNLSKTLKMLKFIHISIPYITLFWLLYERFYPSSIDKLRCDFNNIIKMAKDLYSKVFKRCDDMEKRIDALEKSLNENKNKNM